MKEKTLTRIRKFTEDRHWEKFHSPANLAKSISIEASELADVIIYSQDLLDKLNLDVDEIVDMKMAMNEKKYPIDKCNQ